MFNKLIILVGISVASLSSVVALEAHECKNCESKEVKKAVTDFTSHNDAVEALKKKVLAVDAASYDDKNMPLQGEIVNLRALNEELRDTQSGGKAKSYNDSVEGLSSYNEFVDMEAHLSTVEMEIMNAAEEAKNIK